MMKLIETMPVRIIGGDLIWPHLHRAKAAVQKYGLGEMEKKEGLEGRCVADAVGQPACVGASSLGAVLVVDKVAVFLVRCL
jgi:hypothetical protein